MNASVMGSPFDYPISSRLDENDAVFIMDKVLVPIQLKRDAVRLNHHRALVH
jgi:aromatic ring hydroxylase